MAQLPKMLSTHFVKKVQRSYDKVHALGGSKKVLIHANRTIEHMTYEFYFYYKATPAARAKLMGPYPTLNTARTAARLLGAEPYPRKNTAAYGDLKGLQDE